MYLLHLHDKTQTITFNIFSRCCFVWCWLKVFPIGKIWKSTKTIKHITIIKIMGNSNEKSTLKNGGKCEWKFRVFLFPSSYSQFSFAWICFLQNTFFFSSTLKSISRNVIFPIQTKTFLDSSSFLLIPHSGRKGKFFLSIWFYSWLSDDWNLVWKVCINLVFTFLFVCGCFPIEQRYQLQAWFNTGIGVRIYTFLDIIEDIKKGMDSNTKIKSKFHTLLDELHAVL